MAIAFYSTLFGAVLGAVVLRMLSVSLTNSLIQMSCGLYDYMALLPRSVEDQLHQAARDFSKPLHEIVEQFVELKTAAANARSELDKFASATLNSRLESISTQLELCAAALKEIKR
jgi:hypothetical protein